MDVSIEIEEVMVKLVTIQFLNSCMNLLLRIIIYIIHMIGKIRREDSGIQMLRMLRLNGKTWPNGI